MSRFNVIGDRNSFHFLCLVSIIYITSHFASLNVMCLLGITGRKEIFKMQDELSLVADNMNAEIYDS